MADIIPPPGSDTFHGNTGNTTLVPGPGPGSFSDFGATTISDSPAVDPPAASSPLTIDVKKEGFGAARGGRQWIRNWRITMGSSSGQNLDLSSLRMRFKVAYQTSQHPTYIDLTITNPSEDTANKIDKEGIPVTLECGYENRVQVIFKGQAVYKRYGRESPTDTYLNIIAKSGDPAYNHAHVSKTLAAGHTFEDQVRVATDAMKQYGVDVGFMAKLDPRKFPRSITLFGMARDVLRRVALANDASWTIHNNKIQMIKNKEGIRGGSNGAAANVIVINSDTGMIGRPVQTFKGGVEVRTLLNPEIGPGRVVKIDEKSIERIAFSPSQENFAFTSLGNKGGNLTNTPATWAQQLATNGEYIAASVEHTGDTHGQEWYTDITCYNPNAPPSPGSFNENVNTAAQPYMGMPVTDENKNAQSGSGGTSTPSTGGT